MTDRADGLLALAQRIAREAAAQVRTHRDEGVEVAGTKSSATDVVTIADQASEDLIRERILAARPNDAILGEEGDDVSGTSGVRWVVDPIDGTVNYVLGLPQYAVSIAVEVDGLVTAGVVLNAATGREYTAVKGDGSWCDGRPLHLRPRVPVDRAVVGTGFAYDPQLRAIQAPAVATLLTRVADIRRLGSCALDLCAVAEGRLDAYVEEGCNPWDYGAGGLVAQEAGACVEVLPGAGGRDLVVAAPRATYDAFLGLVSECGFTRASP